MKETNDNLKEMACSFKTKEQHHQSRELKHNQQVSHRYLRICVDNRVSILDMSIIDCLR